MNERFLIPIRLDRCEPKDEKLFGYIDAVLIPEARERAQRDYQYVPMEDSAQAIRARTDEKLREVARHFGFLEGFDRWLERERSRRRSEERESSFASRFRRLPRGSSRGRPERCSGCRLVETAGGPRLP